MTIFMIGAIVTALSWCFFAESFDWAEKMGRSVEKGHPLTGVFFGVGFLGLIPVGVGGLAMAFDTGQVGPLLSSYGLGLLLYAGRWLGTGITMGGRKLIPWARQKLAFWRQRHEARKVARAKERLRDPAILKDRCLKGVQRARHLLIEHGFAGESTSGFDEATGGLLAMLDQLLRRDQTLSGVFASPERTGEAIARSMEEADGIFEDADVVEVVAPLAEKFRLEHGNLVEQQRRIRATIEAIVFVCQNLWIATAGAWNKNEGDLLESLQENLSSLSEVMAEERGSEILAAVESGGLQRNLQGLINFPTRERDGKGSRRPRQDGRDKTRS